MGLFDQIVNEINKKIAAKANQKIHEMTSGGAKSENQAAVTASKHPLHVDELDDVLERERKRHQSYKKQCVEEYRQVHFVDRAFNELVDQHSFDMFDQMPEDLRQGRYFKQKLGELMDHHMRLCCRIYDERLGSISLIYTFIKELAYFSELEDMTKAFLINAEYFSSEGQASRSVLNLNTTIKEQFDRILAAGMPKSISQFAINEMLNCEVLNKKEIQGRKLSDKDVNVCVVSNAMLGNVTPVELDELKQMVLYLALSDDRSREALDTNVVASRVAVMAFGITTNDENGPGLNPGVDFVIADAIRSAKSGNVKEFDERLQGWLEECGRLIAADQYAVFQAVFNEIGAYSSECVLLDYVIQQEIEHTVEQEKRLAFLKENKNALSQDMSKFTPVATDTGTNRPHDSHVLIYDHRFLSWSTNEIEKYFKGLAIANKNHVVAAVVDKWTKNVTIDSRRWDNTAITHLMKETIAQEFDSGYEVNAVKAGVVIDDEVDATPAVYIKATSDARYSDLSFLVVGEPMTKTQLSLSILVIATPEIGVDANDKLLKRIVAVKEKHNPRLETYIETFKSIVIERMNSWIIQVNGAQDIY